MPPGPAARDGAVLEGALERITYADPETGYTTARIDAGRGPDLLTVVGPLLGAQVGESLRMRGRWISHPRYGKQFEVFSYTTVLPATVQGIQRYLGSGLIKGIGPVMAERMVKHFGVDIMHIIDYAPERLIEVDGLGPKRTAMITAARVEQKAIKEVMVFLQGVGVSTSLAVRISPCAGRGHSRPPHSGAIRPGPPSRRAGAVSDAPRPGWCREPEPAAAGGAHSLPRRPAGTPVRRAGVPRGRQGDPAPQ